MDGPSSCHILWSPQRLGLNSLDLLTLKQVFSVIGSQRVNWLKLGANKTSNVLINCKMQELWVCTSPYKQISSYLINSSLIPNTPYCYTLKLPKPVHIFRK